MTAVDHAARAAVNGQRRFVAEVDRLVRDSWTMAAAKSALIQDQPLILDAPSRANQPPPATSVHCGTLPDFQCAVEGGAPVVEMKAAKVNPPTLPRFA